MYKIIRKLWRYIVGIKRRSVVKKTPSIPETDPIGAITFKLNSDQTIDISCHIPETDHLSVDHITLMAEHYAKLLMYINDGLLSTKIIDFIKDTIKTSKYEQDQLFFENVLIFWAMHHVEYITNKKTKSDQPLIMPSRVFNP